MRILAGATVEVAALSPTLRVRRLANAFISGGSVAVATIEATWVLRGAFRSCVIGVVAALSTAPYLQIGESAASGEICQSPW